MPKVVDHEQRRREIAAAVWRLASTHGLESVSLRQVAAEAGVSMRLVQYYFETKDRMLRFALRHLNEVLESRVRTALGSEPTPREIIRTSLAELVPADEHSRMVSLVFIAYFVRALSDPVLGEAFQGDGTDQLAAFFAGLIRDSQAAGHSPSWLDPEREAATLLAVANGMGPDVLIGTATADDVLATLDYNLDRVFPPR
ncbi:TetR/AcrR family transcriptional regulator [Kutzneria sp. CA-103260]|uniref:TetR/AcrR family transcriptional regulator n=1 Tax=Kutzneria sp. CA-103260 TaxID=2802641 RepID=UPI001BA54932|nr:TetR/AcrR family transcriptional regulator [Kutzneria sp. CA-103260]QUQ66934.1 HTH-type transcriptional regulator BetI [Kutzneria sp. CA-103260]